MDEMLPRVGGLVRGNRAVFAVRLHAVKFNKTAFHEVSKFRLFLKAQLK